MRKIDFTLIVPAVLLVFLGLATFFSIDREIFKQQAIFLVIAIFFYVLFLNFPVDLYIYYLKYFYVLMFLLLLITFIIGIEARGSIRWIEFLGVRIQFSEVLKPIFVLFFAAYISSSKKRNFSTFVKILLLFSPILFLILRQPDLGNAVIYFFALCAILIFAQFPISYLLFLAASILLPMPIIFHFLHDYQRVRIYSFLNQTSDPFGSSYNAVQSIISVGSGGILGKGFGQITQSILRFLPERHTDFIFATISEAMGLAGGVLILSLYLYLLYRIYLIGKNARSEVQRLVGFSFFFLFLTHIFFNIGMNIGILPIVGITLPFVSYGGSSLVTNFIILGILSSISLTTRSFGKSVEI